MIESCLTYINITQENPRRQNTETPSQGPWNIYKWILHNYAGPTYHNTSAAVYKFSEWI